MVSVGYVEELFFRAYLIERLGQLGRPRGQAVAIAAVMFSVGHGYQGWAALVFALLAGAALGALWLRRRRLIGFAAGHALYNLTAIGLSTWYG
jgi:membrane protease YdiL (CAAX protease family)